MIPKTMAAVVYRGANDLRLERVPVPEIGANELLVKVHACGVCPTDIKKIQYGTIPPPRIFGHETAGVIAAIGASITDYRLNERVALHHHVPCLSCHACKHHTFAQCAQYKRTGITAGFEPAGGGYAEYVRVMDFVLPGVVRIPEANSFAEGAMLEPVNTVLKAVRRLNLLTGDTVLVAGQGPIGLMFTRLLTLRGIKVLASDMFPSRLRLAKEFGAAETVQVTSANGSLRILADKAGQISEGKGLDAAVVAVASDAVVKECQSVVRGGGQVLLFSHTRRAAETAIDLASVCVDEKDLIGSYSADFTLQDEVARLVFSRELDVRRLITHEFGLEDTKAAVALAAKPTPDSLKVIVVAAAELNRPLSALD